MNQFISSNRSCPSLLAAGKIIMLYGTILASFLIFAPLGSFAAVDTNTSATNPAIQTETDSFEYILEGRADPFVPFLTEKATVPNAPTLDMSEIIEKDMVLTGMQLFEPGQLTLVALLQGDSGDLAMVQDFTGKGYVISRGTKIGRRGVVKDIATNTVIIEETAETRAGKKIITKVVMTLKTEGEE